MSVRETVPFGLNGEALETVRRRPMADRRPPPARRRPRPLRRGAARPRPAGHPLPAAQNNALRLLEAFRQTSVRQAPGWSLSVSIGAVARQPGSPVVKAVDLLTQADRALYGAKSKGKDRTKVHAALIPDPVRARSRSWRQAQDLYPPRSVPCSHSGEEAGPRAARRRHPLRRPQRQRVVTSQPPGGSPATCPRPLARLPWVPCHQPRPPACPAPSAAAPDAVQGAARPAPRATRGGLGRRRAHVGPSPTGTPDGVARGLGGRRSGWPVPAASSSPISLLGTGLAYR